MTIKTTQRQPDGDGYGSKLPYTPHGVEGGVQMNYWSEVRMAQKRKYEKESKLGKSHQSLLTTDSVTGEGRDHDL